MTVETTDLRPGHRISRIIKGGWQLAGDHGEVRRDAAIRDEAGRIHVGANVENASYPCSTCAEASAISAMISGGGREIRSIAIAGPSGQLTTSGVRVPPRCEATCLTHWKGVFVAQAQPAG